MSIGTSRREWLKATGMSIGAWIGAGLTAGCGRRSPLGPASENLGGGSIRVAHLTDVHVQPELGAHEGFARCLRHLQSQKQPPALILNTGDSIYDALYQDRSRTEQQWELWRKVLRDECSLPVKHCLGNHDMWGWGKERSGTTGSEPGWGKQWALDELGMDRPYHAFDHGAWRFIMLDSCQPLENEEIWHTRLDDEQFAWLEAELSKTNRPVLIGSHVPIMSPAVLLDPGRIGGTPDAPALAVRRCHIDVKRIGQLFAKHPHVKLCISGHLHQIDRADYRGVTYMSNPAVSGGWWKGKHIDTFGAMYTLFDLHQNGTFDVEHVDYGWQMRTPAPAASEAQAAS